MPDPTAVTVWFCPEHGWTTEAFNGTSLRAPTERWVDGKPPQEDLCAVPRFQGKAGICGLPIKAQACADLGEVIEHFPPAPAVPEGEQAAPCPDCHEAATHGLFCEDCASRYTFDDPRCRCPDGYARCPVHARAASVEETIKRAAPNVPALRAASLEELVASRGVFPAPGRPEGGQTNG